MLARLMILTAPAPGDTGQSHLAYRLLHAMDKNAERKRQYLLEQAFGTPFAMFLLLGLILIGWQVFCTFFAIGHTQVAGFAGAVESFFAAYDRSPSLTSSFVFEWGQGFFYILCLGMMGFLLRSYSNLYAESRVALLVLASYIVAGMITFLGLGAGTVNPDLQVGLIGHGPAAAIFETSATLFDRLVLHSGVLGLAFMACILFVPLAFIWLAQGDGDKRDKVITVCGTVSTIALFASVFFSLHPALDGFLFLCWMGVFLAWGGAERRMAHVPA